MGSDQQPPKKTPTLRESAEVGLQSAAPGFADMTPAEISAVVRELHLRQIELEQHNEALRQEQARLEEATQKYRDYFELAPLGFLTLDKSGVIQEANLTAAQQLGVDRDRLIHQPLQTFIHEADIDHFCRCLHRVFQEPASGRCEIRLKRSDGAGFYARLDCLALPARADDQVCRTAITDISDMKQAEHKLQESQRLLAAFIGHLPGVAVIRDATGRYLFANAAWEQTFQTTREEWQGKTLEELWPPKLAAKFREQDRLVLETGEALQTVGSLRHPEGWRHWITHRFPILDQDGKTVMIGFNAVDITEAMENKMRLEHLLASGPAAVYTCAAEGVCAPTYISDNVKGLVGWEPRQFLDDPRFWIKHVHPEDRRRVLRRLEFPWSQDHQSYEYRFLAKDGAYRWMHDDLKLLQDPDGQPVEIAGAWMDITAHKQMQQELAEAHHRLERLIEAAPLPILAVDREGHVTRWNPAAQRVFGWTATEVLGRFNPLPPGGEAEFKQFLARHLAGETFLGLELKRRRKDGVLLDVRLFSAPLYDPQGEIAGAIAVLQDITAAKRVREALRESEAKFRATFDQAPIGAAIISPEYRFQRVNAELCRITGYSEGELTSSTFLDITHPEDRPSSAARAVRLGRGAIDHYQVEKRYIRKDGETVWVRVSVRQVKDAQGAPLYFLSMIEDVTERRQDKEALRQSEANYHHAYELIRSLIDTVPDLIWAKDMQDRFLLANQALCRKLLMCAQPEDAIGKTDMCFAERERRAGFEHTFGELCVDSDAIVKETKAPCRFLESGNVRNQLLLLDVYKAPFLNAQGEMIGTVGCGRDITKEKAMEEALQESEKHYRLLVNQIPAVVFKGYADWRVDFFDEKVEALTGYPKADFDTRRLKWCDLILPEDQDKVRRIFIEALKTDKAYVREYRIRKKTGEIAWIQCRGQIFLDAAGRIDYISGVFFDITARQEAAILLHQERQRLFALLDLLPALVCLVAPDCTLPFVNRQFRELFGDPQGRTCHELIHGRETPCDGCQVLPIFATRQPFETERTTTDGGVYHVYNYPFADIDGSPMVLQLGMDITTRKALEAQLMQAQKMEAVGRLAGGVAHDFNNLLMAIMGYGELMRNSLLKDDPLYHYSEDILKATERAASLTQQLLAFSRRQMMQPQMLNLNRVIGDLEKMLRRLIGEDIELEIVAGIGLGTVKADPGQMGQIIMNLALNARDAMPTGGRLSLETANIDFAASHTCYIEAAPPGRYVRLSARDTGEGMDAETLTHIFEPFFTTKEMGKGTGLGLPMVYGIVKQNCGHIEVDSRPGQGAAFHIYLPRLDAPEETPRDQKPLAENLEGSETILVVEDEDALRTLLCRFFRLYGYNVLEARHGGEALLLCERQPGPIHLMITDVVMPQMSGLDLAARLGPLRPEMKVFFMSGYTDRDLTPYGVPESSQPFLAKPFRPMDLVKKVRDFLDASGEFADLFPLC